MTDLIDTVAGDYILTTNYGWQKITAVHFYDGTPLRWEIKIDCTYHYFDRYGYELTIGRAYTPNNAPDGWIEKWGPYPFNQCNTCAFKITIGNKTYCTARPSLATKSNIHEIYQYMPETSAINQSNNCPFYMEEKK